MSLRTYAMEPVAASERFAALDILRGLALMGVLLVNLESDFRVSLARHILVFHTDPNRLDCAMDVAVAGLLEFKAITIFSLLFGAGSAIFAERAAMRGMNATRFLARRYLFLLLIGLCHLLLIWNGDILTLYAVCGALLLPILRMKTPVLGGFGIALVCLSFLISWDFLWPTDAVLHRLAFEADSIYATGSFKSVLAFHWHETRQFILPLLSMTVLRTWGLMTLGAAAWRAGVFRDPHRHGDLLRTVAILGGSIGVWTTFQSVTASSTGHPAPYAPLLLEAGSYVPLALAYTAIILLLLQSPIIRRRATLFQAAGQMALTNYLMQSVVLSLLFYGYGLGLSGRLGSASAVLIGIALYVIQLGYSVWWLRRYHFGPVEWLWRTLTYGRRQPMRRG